MISSILGRTAVGEHERNQVKNHKLEAYLTGYEAITVAKPRGGRKSIESRIAFL